MLRESSWSRFSIPITSIAFRSFKVFANSVLPTPPVATTKVIIGSPFLSPKAVTANSGLADRSSFLSGSTLFLRATSPDVLTLSSSVESFLNCSINIAVPLSCREEKPVSIESRNDDFVCSLLVFVSRFINFFFTPAVMFLLSSGVPNCSAMLILETRAKRANLRSLAAFIAPVFVFLTLSFSCSLPALPFLVVFGVSRPSL